MRSVYGRYLAALSGCPQQVLEPQTYGEVEAGPALDKVGVHQVALPLQVEDLYNKSGKKKSSLVYFRVPTDLTKYFSMTFR